jgi:alpha-tubulin suppressor-like RCC1 family protein
LDDAYYLVDGVYGTTSRYEDVLQVSIGAHHTAVLKCDGTVTASGSNSFGQCDVSSLHDIRQVIAAASCTYALRQDDIVQVAGKTDSPELVTQALPGEMLPALEGWDDVLRLAYSPGHLSALHKKVHVSSNVRLQMHDLTHLLHENDMQKAIAAGRDYTLVLRKDGTVRYDGEKKDVGSAVKLWKDVRAIAGDSLYAIGLTPDGRLHLAGGSPSSVLAAGRTDAAQWENVAAVTCGDSVIAAVTADGELLLAGNAPRRTELLDTWARDVRPALLHMIYSLN